MQKHRRFEKSVGIVPSLALKLSIDAVANAQSPQDFLGIFCNGQTNPEMETRWNIDRQGRPLPDEPNVPKVLEYFYALAEDAKGKYSFRLSSYWNFSTKTWRRARTGDTWRPYKGTFGGARTKKDDQNRLFYYFDFDTDGPRDGAKQIYIRVRTIPYDPSFILVSRVYSTGCTKSTPTLPPPPEPACRWVETMVGQPISSPYCECGGRAVDKSRCGR